MSQTLTLEIPDDVFKVLLELSRQEGKTPAEMGAEWVTRTIENLNNDPLEKFIGGMPSAFPDWADRHDAHLGAKQMRDMSGAPATSEPDA